MSSNEPALLAVIAKQLRELRDGFARLSKQPGPAGRDGIDGKDGVGTPGKDGRDGIDGKDGRDGIDGKDGRDGIDGKDGERGPMPDHQWKGTRLRFQKPDGEWGKYTDLKGERGTGGGGGGSFLGGGWSPDGLPAAADSIPEGFLVRQGGNWAVATYDQMAGWLGGGAGPGETYALLTEGGDPLVTESGDNIVQD